MSIQTTKKISEEEAINKYIRKKQEENKSSYKAEDIINSMDDELKTIFEVE